MKKYRFIYNHIQALFYMNHGQTPIKIDKHPTTNNTYFQFVDSDELQRIFRLWMSQKD